jgi:hypothetical protein
MTPFAVALVEVPGIKEEEEKDEEPNAAVVLCDSPCPIEINIPIVVVVHA